MKHLFVLCILALGLNAHALKVNDQAPCVVLNHVNTDNSTAEHCIRDHAADQKFTLIEFFSISCSDCTENLPILTELGASVSSQATTRMVSIDRKETEVKKYISQNRQILPFEIALDSSRDAKKAYGVVATPTLFVLDENNKIIFKHVGILKSADTARVKFLVLGY